MKSVVFTLLVIVGIPAGAADDADFTGVGADADHSSGAYAPGELARDPAGLVIQPRKRTGPGAHEEDLQVLPNLPKAELKTDARTLQRDVYKAVYNQELKEERHDETEE